MVDQVKRDAAPTHGKSYEQNPGISLNGPSPARSQSQEIVSNDDLILSLADAYENKRARQVNEWEGRQRAAAAF